MNFVRLHNAQGVQYSLNIDHVAHYYRDETEEPATVITLVNGDEVYCKETPDFLDRFTNGMNHFSKVG